MADINTGLEIEVSAVVDEASAKEAGKKLNTYVLNSLKDGYIKIPAAVEAEFKKDGKASKELREAHREFIKQWKKMSSVGFDSSSEDLDDFIKKYNKFTKLMNKEGQYNTRQNNALKESKLGSLLKSYTDQMKILEKQVTQLRKTDVAGHKLIKSGRRSKLSSEELNKHMKSKESYTQTPSKARTNVKAPEHVTETTLKETKYQGPYRSGLSRMNAQSIKEERPNELKSLKTRIIGVKKANEYAEKILNEGKLYDSDVIRGRNKTSFSETEKSSKVSKASLKEAARLLGDIERGKKGEKGIEDHRELVQGSFALNQISGKPILDTTLDAVNSAVERYFKDIGSIELGGDEYAKGEGPGHELAVKAVKHTLDIVKEELAGVDGISENPEFQRQMRELGKIDPEEAIRQVSGLVTLSEDRNTILKQFINKVKFNKSALTDATNLNSANGADLNPIKTITEKILTQNKVEGASERVADDRQSAIDLVNKNTNISALKVATDDAEDGFNSEANTSLLIRKQQASNSIADQSQNILDQISASLGVEEQNSKKKDTNVTVLTQIRDLLQALCRRLLPGSDITSDTVDNKRRITGRKKDPTLGSSERDITGISSSKPNVIELPTSKFIATTTQPENNLPALTEHGVVDVGAIEKERKLQEREQRLNDAKAKSLELEKQIEHERKKYFSDKLRQQLKEQREAHQAEVKRQIIERLRNRPNERKPKTTKSQVDVSIETTFLDKLKKVLTTSPLQSEAERIMKLNEEEQERMRAERINKFGLNRGKSLSDTGDIAQVKRTKSLFGWNYNRDKDNKELFNDIKLTEGLVEIDTKKIMEGLDKVLTGPEMFKAQTGGVLRNVIGSMTGYIGMPSIEKSRAKAEGLNQVMSNVRNEILTLIQDIQSKESTLRGMEQSGTAIFSKSGKLLSGNSAAQKTLDDLEEQKQALAAALAETRALDKVIASCGGKVDKIVKRIGFVMPELRQNNVILKNIGAGLDKNGKALKFQSRTAEILNYTFQLMSRYVGQMWKNWLMMINPLTQIKKLFNDFMSYDVKWQRTMNVIKYNLRAIVKPMMQWIAQKLVNIIGFFDIILMKIQEAFGRTPISLFDQSAADAEKMKEQLEEAVNVSAGFDELHDISGETGGGSAAENLFGDIYKPQLSPEWKKLAEDIGNLFKGIITGDLGFGEVMKEILCLTVEAIKLIAQTIWDAIKNSTIGQYIQNHWKDILAGLAAAFLAWGFLKWAGNKLLDALFGKLFAGGIFSKLGTTLTNGIKTMLGSSKIGSALLSIGSGMLLGVKAAFNGIGLIDTLKMAFTNPALVAEIGGWGKMLGVIFAQAFGVVLGGATIAKGFDMNADAGSYNIGLREAGGNKEDEKSYAGGNILGAVGGGLLGMFLVGGPLAIGIGAIAGLLVTSLAPAFEQAAISARDANNEMQKIEYYQGLVQGYSTEVSKLTEMESLLRETLRLKTQAAIEEGVQLGHNRDRMVELTNAVLNGTFTIDMLSSSEQNLTGILTNLSAQQEKNRAATEKLEAAKRKLQKAEIDLAIAEDVAAGNFELAAARIEYAEAAMLYTEEEATKKRIQLYKEAGTVEAQYLLQDLSPELREKMIDLHGITSDELASLAETWRNSSEEVRQALLAGVGPESQAAFEREMQAIDAIVREHQNIWQGIGDTLAEIFTLGFADTWTYNGEKKAVKVYQSGNGSYTVSSMAVGTNYVPNDGLVYLHQGEAVIPKKYNKPYEPQGISSEERAYMQQMISTMKSLDGTIKQGIPVSGQFTQRGSDLVAVVNRTKSQTGADVLSNVSYAR